MQEERILTQHPQGKEGVHILKRRYDLIRDFIVQTIEQHGRISYQDLSDLAVEKLSPVFDGKVGWYIVTVKLDLEAKRVIERIPKSSPHELQMMK